MVEDTLNKKSNSIIDRDWPEYMVASPTQHPSTYLHIGLRAERDL
jgi:hypothetical protein